MFDAAPTLTFDGRPKIDFTRGEDRVVLVSVIDAIVGLAIDLTGTSVSLSMPAIDGGIVARSMLPVFVDATTVSQPATPTLWAARGHSLAQGDAIQITVPGGSTLPTGLVQGTTYLVQRLTPNTFGLTTASPVIAPVIITTPGIGTFGISVPGAVTLTNPVAGQLTVTLPSNVTLSVLAGLGQSIELTYLLGGKRRIAVSENLMDVYPSLEDRISS